VIIDMAQASKNESEELKDISITQSLAYVRALGEADQSIFKRDPINFVFGNNHGDVI